MNYYKPNKSIMRYRLAQFLVRWARRIDGRALPIYVLPCDCACHHEDQPEPLGPEWQELGYTTDEG